MGKPLMQEGMIPRFLHGLIEYAAGALFILAPVLFGFDDSSATAASITVGIVILVVAATTEGPTGFANSLSIGLHMVLDIIISIVLIGLPFVLDFTDEDAPTYFFIGLGIAHLLITIATRFEKAPAEPEEKDLFRDEP